MKKLRPILRRRSVTPAQEESRLLRASKKRMEALRAYRERVKLEKLSCLRSLDFIDKLATIRAVRCNSIYSGRKNMPVISVLDTAEALQICKHTLYARTRSGVIPAPILNEPVGRHAIYYYHLEEVRTLVRLIGEHEKEFSYLRKSHVNAVKRIAAAIEEVRKTFKTN